MAFTPAVKAPVEALDRADQALYRAKAAGRDAVWVWDSTQNAPVPTGLAQFDSTMLQLLLDGNVPTNTPKAGPHVLAKSPPVPRFR
mgnify:CR=1 FL=1